MPPLHIIRDIDFNIPQSVDGRVLNLSSNSMGASFGDVLVVGHRNELIFYNKYGEIITQVGLSAVVQDMSTPGVLNFFGPTLEARVAVLTKANKLELFKVELPLEQYGVLGTGAIVEQEYEVGCASNLNGVSCGFETEYYPLYLRTDEGEFTIVPKDSLVQCAKRKEGNLTTNPKISFLDGKVLDFTWSYAPTYSSFGVRPYAFIRSDSGNCRLEPAERFYNRMMGNDARISSPTILINDPWIDSVAPMHIPGVFLAAKSGYKSLALMELNGNRLITKSELKLSNYGISGEVQILPSVISDTDNEDMAFYLVSDGELNRFILPSS